MFCPNCSARNETEQKFCRSCGLNLEKIAESLLLQLSDSQSNIDLVKQDEFLDKYIKFVFGGFSLMIAIAFFAMLYTIFIKFVLSGTYVFSGIGAIAFLIFTILIIVLGFYKAYLKEKNKKNNVKPKKEIQQDLITARLIEEKPFEPVPSVTENSTNLLPVEKNK